MLNKRPLNQIAAAVLVDIGPPNRRRAGTVFMLPFLDVMLELRTINDMYGLDDAAQIVEGFLRYSAAWRGPVALEIKAELRAHLREKSC